MTNRKIEYWVIPPEADGEFVAHREEVLEVYEKPYNPAVPVLCVDEQPVQLLKETRPPIPATAKHAKRGEYERAGTASMFDMIGGVAGLFCCAAQNLFRRPPRVEAPGNYSLRDCGTSHFRLTSSSFSFSVG